MEVDGWQDQGDLRWDGWRSRMIVMGFGDCSRAFRH